MPRDDREPEQPSALAHLADVIVFRSMGALLIAWEVHGDAKADWHVLAAGFAMFFMPDALRGRSSVVWKLIERVFNVRGDDNDR